MEELKGGREGQVYRSDNCVYRTFGFWSHSVHLLLRHLRFEHFYNAPEPFGFDANGNEILSYVEGDVSNYPLTGAIAGSEALCSAAALLRQYHDATISFANSDKCSELRWMLPAREPVEVICHGDYAPYNVALTAERATGIFDFDTAHPSPRIWDVAYAVYCWAPFKTQPYDALGDLPEQIRRAKQFCDFYGLPEKDRYSLVDVMSKRIQALVDFMKSEADNGNEGFIANIRDGHHLAYIKDIEYLSENRQAITQGLL